MTPPVRRILLLTSLLAAACAITLVIITVQSRQSREGKKGSGMVVPPASSPAAGQAVPPPKPEPPVQPALIFVFDDAGQNRAQLEPFLRLPFPLTVAVLPGLPHSAEAARAVRAAGKEVILHQPMRAKNPSVNPGPGAIEPGMSAGQIQSAVRANTAEIAPVAGMNNHEGSLITESKEAIGAVLEVCRAEGLYFLDSRTTADTQAPAAAKERGMTIWQRDVFLDNTHDRADILEQLRRGTALAERRGYAVLIGHVQTPGLAELLLERYPALAEQGFRFSTISAENKKGVL